MTCIFMDGFDWYLTADLTKKYTGIGTSAIVQTPVRSPSGQALQVGTSASGPGSGCYRSFGTNYTQGCMGLAFQRSGTITSVTLFSIGDATTEQISVRTNGSNVLIVSRNGTTLATGSTVLTTGVWYYVELKFTINNTTGVVELKLNGASEIASTGSLNTRNTANTQWNSIGYGLSVSTNITYIDDVYVLDTSTGSNTTFLGPVRVVAVNPSEPGNYAQWTSNGGTNYGNVSEPYEDGDTSFNQSSTANQIDSFKLQDLPVSSGSVFAVSTNLVSRQDAGAARTIAPLWRISGTDYAGTNVTLGSSYLFYTQVYDTSPATSSAWTTTEVAGAEAGYKLIS